MKEYRVSDVAIDSVQSKETKAFLQAKLNALEAEGWTDAQIQQAGDTWFIVTSREKTERTA